MLLWRNLRWLVRYGLFICFVAPVYAIQISVYAPRCSDIKQIQPEINKYKIPVHAKWSCCTNVVGLGVRDPNNKSSGNPGRTYTKSGLVPGVKYSFGFGQGHFFHYKKVGCGRFLVNKSVSALFLCENYRSKPSVCHAFLRYEG